MLSTNNYCSITSLMARFSFNKVGVAVGPTFVELNNSSSFYDEKSSVFEMCRFMN